MSTAPHPRSHPEEIMAHLGRLNEFAGPRPKSVSALEMEDMRHECQALANPASARHFAFAFQLTIRFAHPSWLGKKRSNCRGWFCSVVIWQPWAPAVPVPNVLAALDLSERSTYLPSPISLRTVRCTRRR